MTKIWCILWGVVVFGVAMEVAAEQTMQNAANQAPPKETAESLRAEGPDGLDRALAAFDRLRQQQEQLQAELNQQYRPGFEDNKESLAIEGRSAELGRRIERVAKTIDEIGGQRGCTVSRLYWYTDLDEAKAAAERENRPILSLRMLGKLTDEYSCANSRFFRTALYSNKDISDFLRTNFILHWQSVRPVPRVTIDFGDGRKLERTLTGNSAHYVLASDGTPLDVLPGLYSPLAFRQWLWDVRDLQLKCSKVPAAERAALVQAFHQTQQDFILRRWDLDIQQLGDQRTELVSTRIAGAIEAARLAGREAPAGGPAPKAAVAANAAVGKRRAEAPVMRFANLGGTWMERGMDDDLWQAIANLHRDDVKLDDMSVAVMARDFPRAALARRQAVTKSIGESPLLRLVRTFEDSMTLDTVRNEYLLHRQIHERFLDDKAPVGDVDALNEWVYAELFLTPSADPWLGLAPNDVYTALENDGRTESTAAVARRPGG
jgi:hypothetical protein